VILLKLPIIIYIAQSHLVLYIHNLHPNIKTFTLSTILYSSLVYIGTSSSISIQYQQILSINK
jgi:hypothetical protein